MIIIKYVPLILFELLVFLGSLGLYKWLHPYHINTNFWLITVIILLVILHIVFYYVGSDFINQGFRANPTQGTIMLTIIAVLFYLTLVTLIGWAARSILIALLPSSFTTTVAKIMLYLLPLWFAVIILKGLYNNYDQKVTTYNISVNKKLEQPLKILFIADLHLGHIFGNYSILETVAISKQVNPDFIVISGDIIDNYFAPYKEQDMEQSLKQLHSKYGVYGVLGNHDVYGNEQSIIVDAMTQAGIKIIRDDVVNLQDLVYLVGRRDIAEGSLRKSYSELMAEHPQLKNSDLPIIVLDHQPKDFASIWGLAGDIQLSGHTHAGQTYPASLIIKWIQEYVYGLYYSPDQQQRLIVTSGTGLWGVPLRVGTRAEAVVLNISGK